MGKRAKNTLSPNFSVNAGSVKGKIKISAVEGSVNKTLTLTNAALTDDRTATFQDATGVVAYTSDIAASTGTTVNTFTIDSDSATGKMVLDVTLNTGQNKTMTLTNAAMTSDVTLTLPATTGTVALTSLVGTSATTFTVDNDAVLGKIALTVVAGAADKTMTLTNAALTDDRTVTFQNATGTVALTSDVAAVAATSSNTFTVDTDSTTGKIVIDVALGAADKALTITNAALTDNRTITFPDATGTVALTSGLHTQGSDTGTTASTFTVDSDAVLGKIAVTAAAGAADKTLTLTNAVLTDNRTITFPDATGTVALVPTPQTELTDELTSITHTSPSSPDYAIQDLVQNTGFGFATADEGNTVLSVILNLQTRVNELETKLVALGFLADAD